MEIIGGIFAALNLFGIGLGMTLLLAAADVRKSLIQVFVLAMPVGLVSTSLIYFVWMTGIGTDRTAYLIFETILAMGFAIPILRWINESRHVRRTKIAEIADVNFVESVATVVFLVMIGIFVFKGIQAGAASPLGYWDAWSRINLKAAFLADSTTAFEAIGPRVHHPDYPLLLSATVARWYLLIGASNPWIPLLISVTGSTWLLISLFVFCRESHGVLAGLCCVALCLSLDYFWFWSAMQYSDILLSLFMVLAIYSFNRLLLGETTWLSIYFISVGAAAWCKNEGIAFGLISIAMTTAFVIVPDKQLRKKLPEGSIIGGILLAICFIASIGVKIAAPEATDLFRDDHSMLDKLTDFSRYQLVYSSFFKFVTGGIFVIPALVSVACLVWTLISDRVTINHYVWLCPFKVLVLSIVFFTMYMITPHDLEFHLSHSMDRLILQIWAPTVVSILLLFQNKIRQIESTPEGTDVIEDDGRLQSASP